MSNLERLKPLAVEEGNEAKRHRDLVVMWLRNQIYIEELVSQGRQHELVKRAQDQQNVILQELATTLIITDPEWQELSNGIHFLGDVSAQVAHRRQLLRKLLAQLGMTDALWSKLTAEASQPYQQGEYTVNPLADDPTITVESGS